jgi:hypothetical protein
VETPRPTGTGRRKCARRSWVGRCEEWRWDGGDGEWSSHEPPENVDL